MKMENVAGHLLGYCWASIYRAELCLCHGVSRKTRKVPCFYVVKQEKLSNRVQSPGAKILRGRGEGPLGNRWDLVMVGLPGMPVPQVIDLVNGGLAGAGASLFTNPLDVVKIRMQLQGELQPRHKQVTRYRGMWHALYVIGSTEGVLALQRGLAPALVLALTMNSVRLGIYRTAEAQGWTKYADGEMSILKAALWSSLTGMLGGFVANPTFVIKTRMQAAAHPSIAVGKQHQYKGMLDGASQIYQTRGIRGFFAGVNATVSRVAVASSAQLTTFSAAKEVLLYHGICESSPLGLALLASAASGAAVAVAMCPLDVASTRLYNQGPTEKEKLMYAGVLDALSKIYKTEGLLGLYKGFWPLYFRMSPHTTISLVLWDMLNIYTDNKTK